MSTPIFYHYLSSGDLVSDGLDDSLSDIPVSSGEKEEEEEELLDTMNAMEEQVLDEASLPNIAWILVKYKSSQAAQFISLIQSENCKLLRSEKEIGVA